MRGQKSRHALTSEPPQGNRPHGRRFPWRKGTLMSETAAVADGRKTKAPSMGKFERFLTLWVTLCIICGMAAAASAQTMPPPNPAPNNRAARRRFGYVFAICNEYRFKKN